MKKNNALFIALTAVAVIIIGAIMIDNVTSTQKQSPAPTTVTTPLDQPGLHEAKYWKRS
jgi:hypothetical protein